MANWELRIERLGMHPHAGKLRTYGRYQVWRDNVADPDLQGFMCESPGPGDNSRPNNGRRVEAGTYPLWTQFGSYRSIGYATGTIAGATPMPAIAFAATGRRTGILIHPAHPPKLFLSSVGCLKPDGPGFSGHVDGLLRFSATGNRVARKPKIYVPPSIRA